MINALFSAPNYMATKKLLDATVLRQEAIASNLGHIEMPNYKRVDVAPSFNTELRQALTGKDANRISQLQPKLAVDATAVSANRDGNTVQLEQELLLENQNFVAHALETQMISGSLLRLKMAITGRPA
ncbi:MAG: flagellar basal body rod protein FlgB [Verrucomicrobia bacterium]|nr:flagellar basal body rod protein FlgB [Verrucomicrobiota bacterium]